MKDPSMITLAIYQVGFLKRIELLDCIRFHFFDSEIKQFEGTSEDSATHGHKANFAVTLLKGNYNHIVSEPVLEGYSCCHGT
jgi:hypothetical protein